MHRVAAEADAQQHGRWKGIADREILSAIGNGCVFSESKEALFAVGINAVVVALEDAAAGV